MIVSVRYVLIAVSSLFLGISSVAALSIETAPNTSKSAGMFASDFYTFATIAQTKTSAAFGVIKNATDMPISLQKVEILPENDKKRGIKGVAELHQTTMKNGVMTMLPVDSILVESKSSTQLQPGGYHIMLLDVSKQLKAGESITLKLYFDNGEKLLVSVPIIERTHAAHH